MGEGRGSSRPMLKQTRWEGRKGGRKEREYTKEQQKKSCWSSTCPFLCTLGPLLSNTHWLPMSRMGIEPRRRPNFKRLWLKRSFDWIEFHFFFFFCPRNPALNPYLVHLLPLSLSQQRQLRYPEALSDISAVHRRMDSMWADTFIILIFLRWEICFCFCCLSDWASGDGLCS